MAEPPFIGLTGGIGAGKSTALECLRRLGAATVSSDAVVHELYTREEVAAAVVERFGADLAPGGVIDRGMLAARAFASEDDRAWLEQLLWPLVAESISAWREQQLHRLPLPRALVVESPLMFEAGNDGAYDVTVAIVAPEAARAQRAGARGHRAVDERTARQLSQQEKSDRATYTVVNDGDLESLERKLSSLLAMLQR